MKDYNNKKRKKNFAEQTIQYIIEGIRTDAGKSYGKDAGAHCLNGVTTTYTVS